MRIKKGAYAYDELLKYNSTENETHKKRTHTHTHMKRERESVKKCDVLKQRHKR